MTFPVDINAAGAVLLGNDVVCDGFHRDRPFRVQTHIHDDHMANFDTSKGFQDVLMSEATRLLLVAEFNAELPVRENIYVLQYGSTELKGSSRVTLLPSDHMLGAVQVVTEIAGLRLGYSGDFQWPMQQPIEVDALVVDSTYGNPASVRRYTQAEAEQRFLQLIHRQLKRGSVHVKAHRGTVQRAIQLLSGEIDAPLLCSPRLANEIAVYQRFGAAVASVIRTDSQETRSAVAEGRYLRLYSKGDSCPVELHEGTMIVLSAFMAKPDDPIIEHTERSYGVALSNHADFAGTLEYVLATKAKYVVTDNTRGRGMQLAQAIKERLGVEARPSTNAYTREWGK